MKFSHKKGGKNKGKLILYLILGGFIIKLFCFLFKKKRFEAVRENLDDFVKKEKREIKEVTQGKESFKEYCRDSSVLFKDYFIPCDNNDHKPKILRPKSLIIIVILVVLLKIIVTGYLFFIYPNLAKMHEQISLAILELTNQDRIKNNLEQVVINPILNQSALAKAEDMSLNSYFAHYSPDGKKPWDWISRDEYAYLFVGENLAMNFTSAQAAHQALMQSSTHRKNILNEKYNEIGLAVISGEINNKKTNILVELFASRKSPALALNVESSSVPPSGTTEDKSQSEADQSLAEEPETVPASEEGTKVLAQESKREDKVLPEQIEPKMETSLVIEPESVAPEITVPKDFVQDVKSNIVETEGSESKLEQVANSPNPELENNPNTKVGYFIPIHDKKVGLAAKLIKTSKYIYLGILVIIILALIINILVRISIQHKPVIIETLVVIFFIIGLLYTRIHFLESVIEKVAIL